MRTPASGSSVRSRPDERPARFPLDGDNSRSSATDHIDADERQAAHHDHFLQDNK